MAEQGEGMKHDRTSVELFAGGGGLAMAVHQAGFRPLLLNEFNAHACATLEASATKTLGVDGITRTDDRRPQPPKPGDPAPLYPGDVRELDLSGLSGQVDILAGGPPCQPFSAGGVAKGDEDKRNMFPAMFKAVREMQPKAVICENVRGLLRPSFNDYFEYIQRELSLPFVQRDDSVSWQVHNAELERLLALRSENDSDDQHYRVVKVAVNAADYGVPQVRHRVVLVAFRTDLGVDVDAFEKYVNTPQYSIDALFRSMRDEDGEYWTRHSYVEEHVKQRVRSSLPAKIDDDDCAPWRTLRDAVRGFGTSSPSLALPPIDHDVLDRKTEQAAHLGITDHIGWPGARIYKGHTPNELDRPAKTVKAGVHGVPGGESVMLTDERIRDSNEPSGWRYLHRYMSVRETARAMTFPDEWQGSGRRGEKMRQLGNAVPVTLGEFFAKAVADALSSVGH
ncbi:DNA cytosine methyltransferase [Streptomyces sp. NPDC032198]|uniref:DNA cytosine methyltransferase n=1 Tax=Streptomyces sp. NPDC032198 TaxID=3155127 RepID=UPI0033E4390E